MTGIEWKEKLILSAEISNLNPTLEIVGEVMGEIIRYKDFFEDYTDIMDKFRSEAMLIVKELEAMDFIERFNYYYPQAIKDRRFGK